MNVSRNGWLNERMNPHSNTHMYTETRETNVWIWLIIVICLMFKELCCTPFFQSLLGVCISDEKLFVFDLILPGIWLPNETFLLLFEILLLCVWISYKTLVLVFDRSLLGVCIPYKTLHRVWHITSQCLDIKWKTPSLLWYTVYHFSMSGYLM